jgi:glucose-6-phosphate isomerase
MSTWSDARSGLKPGRKESGSEGNAFLSLQAAPIRVNFNTGEIEGNHIESAVRTIKDLERIFKNEDARRGLDPNLVVYRVQSFFPAGEENGSLGWGTTFLEPGMVGNEYFMTKGHYHARRGRGEFYLTVKGSGALILMDESRHTWYEPMSPHTLHYIPGHTAHRVANTGDLALSFLACWPSDAGHDYGSIANHGFSARLLNVEGVPTLVEEK